MIQNQLRPQVVCATYVSSEGQTNAGVPLIVVWFSCEQVDLLRQTAARLRPLRLTWHRPLPDSGRERAWMRLKAGHSMVQNDRSMHPAPVPRAP
jgi:hypothetical protein